MAWLEIRPHSTGGAVALPSGRLSVGGGDEQAAKPMRMTAPQARVDPFLIPLLPGRWERPAGTLPRRTGRRRGTLLSTDFGDFDVSYLWDDTDPTTAQAASDQGGKNAQRLAGVAGVPPPSANDKFWQYGWDLQPLKKDWNVGIATASHWDPPARCENPCYQLQWPISPVRNAMKFFPRGRTWGTGPNAPKASWTTDLAKYIVKNSRASISFNSCFKVVKLTTTNSIGFTIGFEGSQGTGGLSGSYTSSAETKDICHSVKRNWAHGYANKPVTFDPDTGMGECEDLAGKFGILAYRSELTGRLTFKFYNSNKVKDIQEVDKITIRCDWARADGKLPDLATHNCIRSS
ncbi:hypothetical protein ACFFR3_12375 [Nonomuraea salmonea]|uniref:Uncharacterized protein n=1 Tax=Nonomuraea salmonea TaxID=46181 RepID=A0ABV5NJ26_9ACTN